MFRLWWELFLGLQPAGFTLYPHMVENRQSSLVSLYKALIVFMRAPPSRPAHLLRTPPPNTITLGVRMSTYEIWEDTNIQSIVRIFFVDTIDAGIWGLFCLLEKQISFAQVLEKQHAFCLYFQRSYFLCKKKITVQGRQGEAGICC